MAIPGNWLLQYDWDSAGTYDSVNVTFHSDGSWRSSEGFQGRWEQVEGLLQLNFTDSPVVYTGLVASSLVTGNMTTFGGPRGSWFMVRQDPPAARNGRAHLDLAGQAARC